jgi:biopolymer transport protein ExbD
MKLDYNSEFELDLAPLLAVMVKLVPVLLVSSAFVQLMVVETELPQVVSEAIQRQDEQQIPTNIALEISSQEGIRIIVTEKGQEKVETIALKEGNFDLNSLHKKLIEVKKAHPEIFKIEINPDEKIRYNDIVKIMDEARQARDNSVRFPVFDSKQGKNIETNYMFPEIVFANMMEG